MELRPDDPPAPALTLVAGLALIEALGTVAPAAPLQLKWPNDLMLGGGKLAGILLERTGDRVVAGFGLNLAQAPTIPGRKTVALRPVAEIAPAAFAPVLAGQFDRLLTAWRTADPAQFARAWQARAHSPGTELEVHAGPHERLRGQFDGIEEDGAMRLRLSDGTSRIVRVGDVSLV